MVAIDMCGKRPIMGEWIYGFIIILVPGNMAMVAIDMCRKSSITLEWVYGIYNKTGTWKCGHGRH